MLIFYFLCAGIMGTIVPILLHSIEASLTMVVLLTVMFLKPLLSDSLAGERERKTLEPLLSTSISGRTIIWGKLQFSLLFALTFFIVTLGCAVFTNWLAGYELSMAAWQWSLIIILTIFNFIAISIAGVYMSATSQDLRAANGKISRIAYPLGLLLLAYLSVVFLAQPLLGIITGSILMLIYLGISLIYTIKVLKMKPSNYFDRIKIPNSLKKSKNDIVSAAPKSQFGVVFRHELEYLWTLKILLVNFLILCVAPAIVMGLLKYFTGKINLDYAVLITALMMPRVPTNLAAYSIGGEKTFKTGEALLSTPLRIRPLFLAKCTIPVLITVIMLALSSLVTLVAANLISSYFESGVVYRYTANQLVLLFPVSIMACITMVFTTGVLSVNMRTPRQGLYVSSILGIIFVVLLLFNAFYVRSISDKISRPQLMSRL